METKVYYVTTGMGCCIRHGTSEESVRRKVLREVGEYNGVQEVREAEPKDIAWVKAMGGEVES